MGNHCCQKGKNQSLDFKNLEPELNHEPQFNT